VSTAICDLNAQPAHAPLDLYVQGFCLSLIGHQAADLVREKCFRIANDSAPERQSGALDGDRLGQRSSPSGVIVCLNLPLSGATRGRLRRAIVPRLVG
jgi:hypothetical protein